MTGLPVDEVKWQLETYKDGGMLWDRGTVYWDAIKSAGEYDPDSDSGKLVRYFSLPQRD